MEDADFKKLLVNAQADQATAGVIALAGILAAFYSELVRQCVPHETAEHLVRDYFETLREKMR